MYQFIETICFEQGCFQRMELHNLRLNRTRAHFFGKQQDINLELILKVPDQLINETVKCTVTYGIDVLNIEFVKYTIRPIRSLRLVTDNTLDYAFKYADRSKLNALLNQKMDCDDILIVKNGLITDISYANAIFGHGNVWYSQQNPLLFGTRLESYIRQGKITPALLRPQDLSLFSEVRLINAMISIENSPVIPIDAIHF